VDFTNRANSVGGHPFAEPPYAGLLVSLISHMRSNTVSAGRFREPPGLIDGPGEGFLNEDVFSHLHTSQCRDRVGVIGCGNLDRIDVPMLCVQHPPKVPVERGIGELASGPAGPLLVHIAQSDHVAVIRKPGDVTTSLAAATNGRDVEPLIGREIAAKSNASSSPCGGATRCHGCSPQDESPA
jgi:hypothetical protein